MCSFIPCRPKQVSLFYLTHVCTHIRGWRFPGLAEDSRLQEGNLQQLCSERISRACDGGKVCPGKEKASYHTLTRLSAFYRLSVQLCSFSFRQEWETLKTVWSHVQQLLEWAVKSLCWFHTLSNLKQRSQHEQGTLCHSESKYLWQGSYVQDNITHSTRSHHAGNVITMAPTVSQPHLH